MSKIFDALRKSGGEEPEPRPDRTSGEGEPAREPAEYPKSVPPRREIPEVRSADEAFEAAEAGLQESSGTGPPPAPRDSGGEVYGTPDDLPPLDPRFARELATLRTSVEQLLPELSQRTLMVTASVPGEGASTVAARFAQLLGEDRHLRVSLVDADLRNADDRPVEPVGQGQGFASVLDGTLTADRSLRPTGLSGLEVLPSEGISVDPFGLCQPKNTAPFISYLRGQYHYALLDAAPVLVAPETGLLAESVDGVLLVLRAGRTKREVVQQALNRLGQHGANVLGVVMNRQQYVIPGFLYRRL